MNFKVGFKSGSGDNIFCDSINKIPLKENTVIEKCIEIYNDDEPCFIRKSAIIQRLYCELIDFCEKNIENNIYRIDQENLPHNIIKMINGIEHISYIELIIP